MLTMPFPTAHPAANRITTPSFTGTTQTAAIHNLPPLPTTPIPHLRIVPMVDGRFHDPGSCLKAIYTVYVVLCLHTVASETHN